jgi:hypothetical protein
MRLLQRSNTGTFGLTKNFVGNDPIPSYAILSHTWLSDTDEPTFEDLTNGTGQEKFGYEKIRFCGMQARQNGLEYFWVDTCCINKANHAELSQTISSMFRWYQNAVKCYVYLSDVSTAERKASGDPSEFAWESAFRRSRWFSRGWTLQELLAPSCVEFFSKECKRLGDKDSLKQEIHERTGIPQLALQGHPLSYFTVNERLSWIERRQTRLEEDRAYSLLGIFDIYIAPIYGEGTGSAFKRLLDEIEKLEKCIQDLRLTDPCDDKKRIEDTKGGLLEDSYRWILENPDFQQWDNRQQSRLLWVKGDPGKGKTMLLCGIINELNKSIVRPANLSYFFCQATDARLNNASAVLRGLLYMLVVQQPSLVSHVRKKYDHAGKQLFEDPNAWFALSEISMDIIQDPCLNETSVVIDALDECVVDLPKLLDFIVQQSTSSSRIKWIISSRNWPQIEQRLKKAEHKARLSLELNAESVSKAVSMYIRHKVLQLAQQEEYNDETEVAVLEHLSRNADNTFLWVALVCQDLENVEQWDVLKTLEEFPPGLDSLYVRMMGQIRNSKSADLCKCILATMAIVYRPIMLIELVSLVELPDRSNDVESIMRLVSLCG